MSAPYPHTYQVIEASRVHWAGTARCSCRCETVPSCGLPVGATFRSEVTNCEAAMLARIQELEARNVSVLRARADAFQAGRETERSESIAFLRSHGSGREFETPGHALAAMADRFEAQEHVEVDDA